MILIYQRFIQEIKILKFNSSPSLVQGCKNKKLVQASDWIVFINFNYDYS